MVEGEARRLHAERPRLQSEPSDNSLPRRRIAHSEATKQQMCAAFGEHRTGTAIF